MRKYLLVAALSLMGMRALAQCTTTATVSAPSSQAVCAGSNTAPVTFTGTAASYTWTNNNTATGLAASGTGDIASFAAVNGGSLPISSTVTVTPRGAGLQGFAYVPNNGSNNVSVINIATGAIVATIPTAGEPFGVAVLPDRSKVFVTTVTGGRVEVINTATNDITQHAPYNAPHGLVVSPDGSRVYVNGWGGGGAVSYINTANPTSSTFMTNVANPEGMAITPDGSTLYVASATGGLVAINTTTNIPTFVAAGTNPHGVTISPNGQFVYTANNGSDNVTVVNTGTNAVVATIPVGDAPLGIAVSPDGSKVYVANSGSNNVSVISTASNTVTATIAAGTYPFGVAVSPDGSRVFVTNQNSNNLSVIDASTNAVTSTYATGTKPIGIGNMLGATYSCDGAPETFTITVNPQPAATISYSGSPYCATGSATPSLTGTTGGQYSAGAGLSINSGTGVIDLAASTPGNYTVTYTIPAGGGCGQVQATASVTVSSTATVNDVTNQVLCAESNTTAISFSGTAASYSWTNNTPSIGLAAAGSGDIPAFTAINNAGTPVTATITVTPVATVASTVDFNFTGAAQTFTVPAGVTSIHLKAWGAQGGANWVNNTNFGGYAEGDLAVTPGEVLQINVGGQPTTISGGFNGGGNGEGAGAGGGGASDIRQGGTTLNDRKLVAAGGGGAGYWSNLHVVGGVGGGLTGGNGYRDPSFVANPGGQGATQTGSGVGTCVSFNNPAMAGGFGVGGSPSGCGCEGYGGGGGWYGGAGSGNCRGGGGGSSYIDGVSNGVTTAGLQVGSGRISITYAAPVCIGPAKTFTITVNPKPSWNNGGFSTSICDNQGIGLSISNGGNVPGADYSWTNDNPAIGTPATGSGNGLSFTGTNTGLTNISGLFTVTPSFTSNGVTCTGNSNTFTITVKPRPILASGGVTNVSCNGGANGSASVLASGGNGIYTYSWFPAGGTGATASGLAAGNYTVTVTSNGCFSSMPFSVNQPTVLSSTGTKTDVLCNGGATGTASVVVSGGTAPYTYSWAPSGGTAATASGLTVGNYTVTIKDANNCQITRNFTINQPAALGATTAQTNATCTVLGVASVTPFGGTSPYTYLWSNAQTTQTVTGLTAGSYSVLITDASGCSISKNFTITAPNRSTIDPVSSQTFCAGSNTTPFTFTGTFGTTFSWTNSDPSIGLAAAGVGDIGSFVAANATAAPVTATITVGLAPAPGACTADPRTFTITVNPAQTATFSYNGSPYCSGTGTATPTFSGVSGGVYTAPAGLSINAATGVVDIGGSTPGTYTVTYTMAAAPPCSGATATASITINAPVTAVITPSGPTTLCAGGSVTLSAPATPGATYLWSNGATSSSIVVSAAGSYTVAVSSNGCISNGGPVTVSMNPTPTVNAVTSQNLCNGAATSAITFSGAVPGTVYTWNNNAPSIGLAASGTGDIASFAAVNNGTTPVTALVTVTPTFTNGGQTCPGTAASFSITVNPTPTVNSVADQVLCNGVTTAGVTFSGPIPNTAYTWTNNNTSIGLALSGTGNIAPFTAVNSSNAPVTATITVTPQATLNGRAYVPNNASGTVSMIDLTTGAIVGSPIAVGTNPFGVAVLPDRSKVYVSNTGSNSVSVISTATNTVTGTSPYNAPHGLAASPDGLYVYVNGWTDNAVSRINVGSNVSTFITNVTQPEGMAVSADGSRLYVASSVTPGKLVVINSTNNTVVANITVGDFPQGVTLSADGSKVYVVNNGSASVSVISTASNSVVATIPVGSNPLALAVSPDGTKAYVTNSGNNNVSVINTVTNALTASIAVGNYPYGVAVSPDGSTVYVANRNSNSVSIINATTNAVSSVAVGNAPIALGQFTTASLQCAGTPITFTIKVNPSPRPFAVNNQSLCAQASTQAIDFSTGSLTGTTFSWTNDQPSIGLAASGSGNIPSFVAVNNGSTSITATITVTPSLNGCTGTPVVFTITVRPVPSVNTLPNQVVCPGASIGAITLAGPVSGTTFLWGNDNTSIGLAASGTASIPSFVAVNTGGTVQTATISITPVATGCIGATQSFTITVNPTPSVNAITSQALCNGATTTAINFAGSAPGTVYNWTNSNPSIGLAASGTGNIAAFTAINNGSASTTATITVTPSFTNAGQTCTGTPGTFTYTVHPTPTANAVASQVLCNGAATTAISFSGAVPGTVYSWTNNTPSIGLAASGTGDIASFTATNTTAAPVTATITLSPTANGCTGSAQTFTITVNPTPTVNTLPAITTCAGQTVTVPGFGGSVSGTTFNWTNDNSAIGLASSGSGSISPFTAVNNGTTQLVANVSVTPSANGCVGTPSSFTLTVNPLPSGTITSPGGTLICQGSSLTLQVSGGTSYQWFLNTNPIAGATGATYGATQPGTYTVNITNSFGCTRAASNSITLTLVQKPTANFSFNSYCLNMPVTFSNSSNTTGSGTVTYQWNFGNGQTSTQTSPVATYSAVGSYTVQLVASPAGCAVLNDTIRKTIMIEAPIAGQRLAAQDIVAGRPTEIRARNLPNGQYSWSPATGLSNPSIWYPLATLTQEQEYRIQVSFASGCVTVDTLLVRVQKGDNIFVPTAFSPNNDGVNDVLKPITVGLTSLRMFRVYDRMGREIFSSSNFQQGWDGSYRGQPAPADTYTWVAEGWDHNNQLIRKMGQVLLVR